MSLMPHGCEIETARWCCDEALEDVVAYEGLVAGRSLRALTSARREPYIRHSIRLVAALDERDDAIERLSKALAWLSGLGRPEAVDDYSDRLAALVRSAQRRAGATVAGPTGLN